ncbi:MAG TPA: hypothetical protein VGK73_20260, partial [Polyangiaceae bacterium]
MPSPYLELGPSGDAAGVALLVAGLLALAAAFAGPRITKFFNGLARGPLLAALGLLALVLSALYVHFFLHGGPRIVDATSYYLEARALSEGKLAFDVPAPSAAFRGRFLLFGPHGLAVLFPPGYPAALALGFLAGVPLAVGPVLAALLVLVTYGLTRELSGREDAARAAAVASALCAALRYHTADTMSHGLSALLLAGVLTAAARPTPARAIAAGVAGGWLIATRPVTGAAGVAIGALLVLMKSTMTERPARALAFAAGLVPGVALLLLHQHAATGSYLGSTQLAYYSLADGPPGCFGWGFGANRGCRFEHGDFVNTRLDGGFYPLDAVRITLQRLGLHALDVGNLAPLALLCPWVAFRHRNQSGVRWLMLGWIAVVLGYAPFYYPASYPGGGARLFADALPLAHALLGLAAVELGVVRFLPAAMLLGFALHTIHPHLALSRREGGRPMFEPSVVSQAGVTRGLVFVTTDHGFSLGHDPAVTDPLAGLFVARASHDAHDVALWERLGRPPSYLYEYSIASGRAALRPFTPRPAPESAEGLTEWRLEAEAEWPPLHVASGWTHPDFRPCLSAGRGLHVRAPTRTQVELELVAPIAGEYDVYLGWLADPNTELRVSVAENEIVVTHGPRGCERTKLGT